MTDLPPRLLARPLRWQHKVMLVVVLAAWLAFIAFVR